MLPRPVCELSAQPAPQRRLIRLHGLVDTAARAGAGKGGRGCLRRRALGASMLRSSIPAAFVHPRPFFCTRHRTMSNNLSKQDLLELGLSKSLATSLDGKLTRNEFGALIAEFKVAQVRERLRRELPRALEWAIWESRRYHQSVLTGRCIP